MPKWMGRDVHGKGAFILKIATVGLDLARNGSFTQWIHTVALLRASS